MSYESRTSLRAIDRADEILGGTPIIRHTRMSVYSILGRVMNGDAVEDIHADNPDLERDAIEAAIIYARSHPLVWPPRRPALGRRLVRLFIDESLRPDFALRLNAAGGFDAIHPCMSAGAANRTTACWPDAARRAALSLRKMRATFESWSADRRTIQA